MSGAPQSSPYTFRLAAQAEKPAILDFMRKHWGSPHPLVELPVFFEYYYTAPNGGVNFAFALRDGRIAAAAGYIAASSAPIPDIWVSIWIADPAEKGAGLELMAALPALTGCRTLACNNIRPKTQPFYQFLGHTTGRVGHFYRLDGRGAANYRIAKIAREELPPVGQGAQLRLLASAEALAQSGFIPPQNANPYKDIAYIARRYFAYPQFEGTPWAYLVYGVYLPGAPAPAALLVARLSQAQGSAALRLVDYIGNAAHLPLLGGGIAALLHQHHAEYADLYCAGVDPALLRQAGFCERQPQDENIIPTYLAPLAQENVDYYYFTSRPQGFTLFRADGDQDRPNV